MFTWLRNKEKNIASTAITMFVGSWLLLFCQTCFATSQNSGLVDLPQSKIEFTCHTVESEIDKLVENHNTDDHCLGVCDCDEMTASLKAVEKTANSDKLQKLSFDSVAASILFKDKIASTLIYHRLPFPEQAIQLPRQRYTVLLI